MTARHAIITIQILFSSNLYFSTDIPMPTKQLSTKKFSYTTPAPTSSSLRRLHTTLKIEPYSRHIKPILEPYVEPSSRLEALS